MSLLDKLFGHHEDQPQPVYIQPTTPAYGVQGQPAYGATPRPQNADEQAVARYRYMLQTAPPEDIERAHEEAFNRLTPQQRQMVLQQLSQSIPQGEAQHLSIDPRSLAQATTRAEIRQPGFIERTFGQPMQGGYPQGGYPQQGYAQPMGGMMGGGMMGGGGGMMGGMGGMIAGGLLSSMAGSFIGSSVANSFFSHHENERAFQSSPEAQAIPGGVSDYNPVDYSPSEGYSPDFNQGGGGLSSSADPYGDPGANAGVNTGADTNSGAQGLQNTGYDQGGGLGSSASDPYGDPGASGGFADTSSDSGGDFGGSDFGGDSGGGDF